MDMTLQDAWLAGIGHENFQIRSKALGVLAEERKPDRGVAMQAIRQIEKHGWRGAFEYPSQIGKLLHTEESVEWVATWLEQSDPTTMRDEQQSHLAAWFCEAPIEWLMPRIDRFVESFKAESPPATGTIRSNPVAFANPQVSFARAVERLEASMWSGAKCREELEQVLERCVPAAEFSHIEVRRLAVICEALAAHGECHEEATGKWLDIDVSDPWRDFVLADYRAGAALMILSHGKLPPPVERIVRLFDLDWDWLNEAAEDAIVAGGNRDTLRDLLRLFPGLPWHAKPYLTSALERLRFPGFEETLIEALRGEEYDDQRVRLARVLLRYGSEKAAAVAKEIAAEHPGDPERQGILDMICVDEVLTGRETARTRQHLQDMKRHYEQRKTGLASLNRLMEGINRPPAEARSSHDTPAPRVPASPRPVAGRNDPCPCGSGRKFKKCCGAG